MDPGRILAGSRDHRLRRRCVHARVRALELQTTTWDQGIYMQSLWSTVHGRPFYEAADFETGGFSSFLQVHSAFVLYLLVPIYAALPS